MVARAQLRDLGYSAKGIDHRLRRGRLHPVRRGVYAVGRPELSADGRRMAAVLACGEGAVLSHGSAGELLGISPGRPRHEGNRPGLGPGSPRRSGGSAAREFDITVPPNRKPHPDGIAVHRRPLRQADLFRHRGVPVTAPIRTLIDLACDLDERQLEAAVVQADKLDLIDPETLREALAGRTGERGVVALREVLDHRTFAITDSELERRFLRIARNSGLPLPETGVVMHGFKLDFLWRDLGLVVETDGLRYHRTPSQQARDRRRDQVLTAAGMIPLRFTYVQVANQTDEVEATLRSVAARLRGRRSDLRT